MKRQPTTARAAYQQRREQIDDQLAQLKVALRDHRARAAKHPDDWGYPGDLAYFAEVLGQALTFLGAAPKKGDAS